MTDRRSHQERAGAGRPSASSSIDFESLFRNSIDYFAAAVQFVARSGEPVRRDRKPSSPKGSPLQEDPRLQPLRDPDFYRRFKASPRFRPAFEAFERDEDELRRVVGLKSVEDAAHRSIDNCMDLLSAARLLADQGYFGYASSLAASAYEEAGKSGMYWTVAAGHMPFTTLLWSGLVYGVRSCRGHPKIDIHDLKGKYASTLVDGTAFEGEPEGTSFLLGILAALMGWMRTRNDPEIHRYLENPTDDEARNGAILALSDALRANPPKIASRAALELGKAPIIDRRELARIRNRGRYVDLIRDQVRAPKGVSKQEFEEIWSMASGTFEAARVYVDAPGRSALLYALLIWVMTALGELDLPVLSGGVVRIAWSGSLSTSE